MLHRVQMATRFNGESVDMPACPAVKQIGRLSSIASMNYIWLRLRLDLDQLKARFPSVAE